MELSLEQVVLHQSEYDGPQLLEPWAWLLPEPCSVMLPTALGHLFLEHEDGSVWFLDTWAGRVERVAVSYQAWRSRFYDDSAFQDEYLMLGFVAELLEAGLTRPTGSCFSPFVSPGVGGSLTPENFHPFPVRLHQITSAGEQLALRRKPEGSL